MKRIMSFFIMALLFIEIIPARVMAAEAEAVLWITTTPSGRDSISVKVTTEVANAWLAVVFTDASGEFLDFYQGRTSGTTDLVTYEFDSTNHSSAYNAQVSVFKTDKALLNRKLSVRYFSYQEQMNGISEIIDADNPQNAVELQAECLGLDLTGRYSKLKNKAKTAERIQAELKALEDPTPADVQRIFANVADLAYLNQADRQTLNQLIAANDFLQINKTVDEYKWYENNKQAVLSSLTQKTYKDVTSFNQVFQATCFLYKLSNEHILNLENFLRSYNGHYEENGESITLNFTEFDAKLTTKAKKDYALNKLSGKLYKSLSELLAAFDAAVAAGAAYEPPAANSGGGTSSSGRNSAGRGYFVSETDSTSEGTKDNRLFTDIENVLWAKEGIEYFGSKGYISGKAQQRFYPDDFITREEFVKILVLVFNLERGETGLTFEDVSENAWYYDYVMRGAGSGIVQGRGKRFGVGENISREDMAVMLYRVAQYLNISMTELEKEPPADYDTIEEYAQIPVLAMYRSAIINGMTETEFMPKNEATRAQAVKMIYGLYVSAGLV